MKRICITKGIVNFQNLEAFTEFLKLLKILAHLEILKIRWMNFCFTDLRCRTGTRRFFNILLFYLSVLPECVYVHLCHAVPTGQKATVDPPKLELQTTVSCYVCSENQASVLCKRPLANSPDPGRIFFYKTKWDILMPYLQVVT